MAMKKNSICAVSSRLFIGASALLFMWHAWAAEYSLVAGKTDWRDPASYLEGALPPAGSEIVLPENSAITLADADDFAFVNTMAAIKPLKGSILTVDVPSGTQALNCSVYVSINNSIWVVGTLRKTGAGTLTLNRRQVLGTWGELADYNLNFDIQGGTLAFYPDLDMGNKIILLYVINMATADCVLTLPSNSRPNIWQLNGTGVVKNENTTLKPATVTFSSASSGGSFAGRILGNLAIRVEGNQAFTGTDSPFVSSSGSAVTVYNYKGGYQGICRMAAMGGTKKLPDLPTSIGLDYMNLGSKESGGSAACLHYLGTGETVARIMYFAGYLADVPYVFDSGAHGGWCFSGSQLMNTSGANLEVVLTGSNATESVMSTGDLKVQANGLVEQIIKRGSGVWKLAETGSDSAVGLVSVEEGTLRFDTLREKGMHCALGKAETLFDGLVGPTDEAKRVPYAVRLGGTTNATLEYVGANAVIVTNRAIALAGGVAHVRNSGAGVMRLVGAGGITSDAHTLVLDGDNASENVFSTITNGVGTVSVVKDGAGEWTLAGEQSFSGTLAVKGGTLNLLNPATYTYWKWIFKETLWGCSRYADVIAEKGAENGRKNRLALGELALYDAEGKRQNLYLTEAANMAELQPGQTTYGQDTRPTAQVASAPWGVSPADLFNGLSYHINEEGAYVNGYEYIVDNVGNRNFSVDDPSSWITIVCRLTNSTPEIAAYDIAYQYGYTYDAWASCQSPTVFSIQASVDGLLWDEVATQNEADVPDTNAKWLSDKAGYWNNAIRTVTGNGDCFAVRGAPEARVPYLANISEFAISGGATVKSVGAPVVLPANITMTIDAASDSEATVDGVVLPAGGTLNVVNFDRNKNGGTLPVQFSDASYANVGSWSVRLNGTAYSRCSVKPANGRLTVVPPGVAIFIR